MSNHNLVRNIKGLMLCVVLVFAVMTAGRVEGWLWPVVQDVGVAWEGTKDGRIGVTGHFRKVRQCSFLGMDVKMRISGLSVPVGVTFTEGAQVRQKGLHDFGPWVLDAAPFRWRDIDMRTVHQCRWRPWVTVSRFYP